MLAKRLPVAQAGCFCAWDKSRPVPVEIKWRDRTGKIQDRSIHLIPGWHTIPLESTGQFAWEGKRLAEVLP